MLPPFDDWLCENWKKLNGKKKIECFSWNWDEESYVTEMEEEEKKAGFWWVWKGESVGSEWKHVWLMVCECDKIKEGK